MAVRVIKEKCKGCSKCKKVCPFEAVTIEKKLAIIDESKCTGCGQCVESCKFGAIEQDKDETKVDLSAYKGVWVFAEQRKGKITPVVFELLGEGRKLADDIGTELCAILLGDKVEKLTKDLIAYGADKVYLAEDPELKDYRTDAYAKVINDAIEKYKPEIVLYGATHIGRDLAPCLAVKAQTGLTADCTKLEIDPEDKKIKQTRPAFGGNLMATIVCPKTRPQMSTVRPGVMQKAAPDKKKKGKVINLKVKFGKNDIRTKVLKIVKTAGDQVSLTDAKVIVAGGMGVGGPEGFELLQKLADKFPGGVVAASRAAVDSGWIDHSRQVGQTGTTVKPNIYFACGISGAIQHVAGMQTSDIIIAINKNETAPIFEVADYGIVGDLFKVIPEIIAALP